ncbi:hypothetical protein LSAT2_000447 [Lamellibrachia satsuma]|nr:hypothetical protein LSAT2_000447 [Lamellibrachia satsuma]
MAKSAATWVTNGKERCYWVTSGKERCYLGNKWQRALLPGFQSLLKTVSEKITTTLTMPTMQCSCGEYFDTFVESCVDCFDVCHNWGKDCDRLCPCYGEMQQKDEMMLALLTQRLWMCCGYAVVAVVFFLLGIAATPFWKWWRQPMPNKNISQSQNNLERAELVPNGQAMCAKTNPLPVNPNGGQHLNDAACASDCGQDLTETLQKQYSHDQDDCATEVEFMIPATSSIIDEATC